MIVIFPTIFDPNPQLDPNPPLATADGYKIIYKNGRRVCECGGRDDAEAECEHLAAYVDFLSAFDEF